MILKALHWLLDCTPLFLEVRNLFKKTGFKQDGGQFVKLQKNCVFVMLSLRIKLGNANCPYGPKSSQRVILWDSNPIFNRTQLSAVGESLLCDYPMVVDYILEINLSKRKKDLRMVLFTFDEPI